MAPAPATKAAKLPKPPKARTAPAPARRRPKAGADDRTRQSRGQARKDRILAEAIPLLAAKGFRGTSLAELAQRAGMTHPGLLYYFGSKERLLEEVVQTREDAERDRLEPLAARASVFELGEVARFAAEAAVLTRLYHVLAAENLDPGEPLHEFFVDRYDHARRLVADALAQDVARGDVRSDVDPVQVGAEVIATLMGLELQWLMDPEHIDLVAVVDGYVQGLRARLAP